MENVCVLVGGEHDGKVLVLSDLTKFLQIPVRLATNFGVIRYIKQGEKIDGKTVYRLENDKGETS